MDPKQTMLPIVKLWIATYTGDGVADRYVRSLVGQLTTPLDRELVDDVLKGDLEVIWDIVNTRLERYGHRMIEYIPPEDQEKRT